ncbi:hypothetical protein FRX31_033976 [Thalictrum thalictroides]|uniref:Uncharacterized protein n=1 Tax=Thalictrum thalictroides TaxID=46969 RepID=A0A7J6UW69_THATH|nr:hypothetical protein FRX31_033976 [Thalictrum thalictroides]
MISATVQSITEETKEIKESNEEEPEASLEDITIGPTQHLKNKQKMLQKVVKNEMLQMSFDLNKVVFILKWGSSSTSEEEEVDEDIPKVNEKEQVDGKKVIEEDDSESEKNSSGSNSSSSSEEEDVTTEKQTTNEGSNSSSSSEEEDGDGEDNVRVSIDKAKFEKTPIPVPSFDLKTVKDVVGEVVA